MVRLREEFGDYPLAQARPLLEVRGQELVMQIQVDLDPALRIVVVRNEQLLLDLPAQRFRDSGVEYKHGAAHIVRPDHRVPQVVMAATRSFGQPSIDGVHTEVSAEEIRAGAAREDVASLYDIGLGDVDAAIRFELIAAAHSA